MQWKVAQLPKNFHFSMVSDPKDFRSGMDFPVFVADVAIFENSIWPTVKFTKTTSKIDVT